MASISLEHITKRFADGTLAVDDASVEIADGEFFILVGPSGCGKSTLLNIIVGLERPTEGEVRMDGHTINGLDPKDRNMAMVFQSYAIYPHMSVRENLAFPLRLARWPRQRIDQRVEETAQLLELTELLARRPVSLSGGQRQRVAMGRAIVREPGAFLMDEPLSNLDTKLRTQMRTEISRLQRRLGTTTVYVTHDQTEAMTLGDRLALLRDGRIQQIGPPRDLYTTPANIFVADFIGTPAMNFVPARIKGNRLVLPMLELPLPAAVQDPPSPRALVAGIRPEHLFVADGGRAAPEQQTFEVTVEIREWLGNELIVYFQLETGEGKPRQWAARLPGDSDAREGQRLRLGLDRDRLHLFDAESQQRVSDRH